MECPICGKELKSWEDWFHDQHILMESTDKCPDPEEHYSEEYHHGVYSLQIFGHQFTWNYETPEAEGDVIQKAALMLIQYYRKHTEKETA